jgi:hypothetical protein
MHADTATRFRSIAWTGFAGLFFATVAGNTQPAVSPADLARCAEIADADARLECFDTLTRTLGGARPDARDGPAAAAPASSASVPAASAPEPVNVDAFGAELISGRDSAAPDEIQSHLIGEFTGWRGNTEFRLENGQVWRQAEADRLAFQADAPLVTIRRGAFNTYRLSVEGVNRAVRVRRIR